MTWKSAVDVAVKPLHDSGMWLAGSNRRGVRRVPKKGSRSFAKGGDELSAGSRNLLPTRLSR